MERLVARVRRTVERLALMPRGARVLAAVSGGADSVALVHVLLALEADGICQLAALAHLNHGLRGDAADQDEAFCRHLAASLGRPFFRDRVDVAALARARRVSVESAGHLARYDFFATVAARVDADCVALGHTRDDQAETFLLRLLRGAGPVGLAAMYPRNGLFVRPLVDCSRRDVRRFVAERGLQFREDETNADRSLARNQVRHELIPKLTAFTPGIVRVLGREAAIAREDAEFLNTAAAAAFERLVTHGAQNPGAAFELVLDAAALAAEPPAVARRVVWMALNRMSGGRFIGFDHAEALMELSRQQRRARVARHLPGQVAVCQNGVIVLRPHAVVPKRGRNAEDESASSGSATRPANSFELPLSIPGEVISPLGWIISARRSSTAGWMTGHALAVLPRSWAIVDAEVLPASCVVRHWRPGDRIHLLGGSGTKKLQDLFVDRKVPREARAAVPVVAGPDGRVIWVAGHATSGDFAVTGRSRDVVIFRLRPWRNGT